MVGRGHHARHDVVVVPAPEVLVLETGAVVQPRVEESGQRSVEHSAGAIERWDQERWKHRGRTGTEQIRTEGCENRWDGITGEAEAL